MNKLLVCLAALTLSSVVAPFAQAEDLASFYASNRIIDVEITASRWNNLRLADPIGGRCNFDFIGDRYVYETFEDVRVNGVSYSNVGAKKKSWCGSENKDKPSINLKFDKFNKDAGKLAKLNMGTDALVLNNSVQDPSFLRQCLSYEMFRKAGIAAPLCNFAHVRVNGQDMGLYVNLQPLKKDFFKSEFGGDLGNVYEIALENFEMRFLPRFEAGLESLKKDEDKSLSDIKALIEALDSSDMNRIEQAVDIDQFLRFWAMEMVLSHADGMALANNNAYLYFPAGGKMQVIPWGTDRILESNGAREARSFYLTNRLADRLSRDQASYERLVAYMNQYMNEWNPGAIIAGIDASVGSVQGVVRDWERGGFYGAVEGLRHNVRVRNEEVQSFVGRQVTRSVKIRSVGSAGLCLNTQMKDNKKVTNVWGCDEHPDQRWELASVGSGWVSIKNPGSGNCVNSQTSESGQAVGAWSCDRHPDQTWKVLTHEAGIMFESQRAPGKCLSIGRTENESDAVLKNCERNDLSQVWRTANG